MFCLMDGVSRCLGWMGLVFIAGSLSFSVWGEQKGICVDCVKGDQTGQEIQNMNKLTCQKMMQNPECVNVPRILKENCKNPFSITWQKRHNMVASCIAAGLLGSGVPIVSGLAAGLAITGMRMAGKKGLLTLVAGGSVGVLYLFYKYHRELKKSRSLAAEKGWNEDQHSEYAKAMTLSHIAEPIYNTLFPNNLHCYNYLVRSARVCGTMVAVVGSGVTVGGV